MTTALIAPDEGCKITNHENIPLSIQWDNVVYVLPPDTEMVVPSDVAILGWGDPRSTETQQKWKHRHFGEGYIPSRPEEVFRLRQRWAGWGSEQFNMFGDEGKVQAPNVTIKTLQGDKIISVVDDPDGTSAIKSNQELTDEQMVMQAMMDKMKADYEEMQHRMNSGQSYAVTNEDDLPEDTTEIIEREPQVVTAQPPTDLDIEREEDDE